MLYLIDIILCHFNIIVITIFPYNCILNICVYSNCHLNHERIVYNMIIVIYLHYLLYNNEYTCEFVYSKSRDAGRILPLVISRQTCRE